MTRDAIAILTACLAAVALAASGCSSHREARGPRRGMDPATAYYLYPRTHDADLDPWERERREQQLRLDEDRSRYSRDR